MLTSPGCARTHTNTHTRKSFLYHQPPVASPSLDLHKWKIPHPRLTPCETLSTSCDARCSPYESDSPSFLGRPGCCGEGVL